jgi:hypothetical protein
MHTFHTMHNEDRTSKDEENGVLLTTAVYSKMQDN